MKSENIIVDIACSVVFLGATLGIFSVGFLLIQPKYTPPINTLIRNGTEFKSITCETKMTNSYSDDSLNYMFVTYKNVKLLSQTANEFYWAPNGTAHPAIVALSSKNCTLIVVK